MFRESSAGRASGTPVIVLTFLVAAWLEVLPLPEMLDIVRPEWMAMVLIYWIIALPHRIGIIWAFGVGLFQSALTGVLLGQYALAYVLMAYLTLLVCQRLRVFSPLQQSAVVFLLVGTALLVSFAVQSLAGETTQTPLLALAPAVTSAVLWRVLYQVLRYVRLRFWIN